MYQSLFLLKLQAKACHFIKKETLAQMFSCEFCEIFKNTFFTEHLWTTSSRFRIFLLHPFHLHITLQFTSRSSYRFFDH